MIYIFISIIFKHSIQNFENREMRTLSTESGIRYRPLELPREKTEIFISPVE